MNSVVKVIEGHQKIELTQCELIFVSTCIVQYSHNMCNSLCNNNNNNDNNNKYRDLIGIDRIILLKIINNNT